MKEYIEKQELDRLPIVTQADLESRAYNRGAREFAEKLKEAINKYEEWSIEELLKEMGCCDGI